MQAFVVLKHHHFTTTTNRNIHISRCMHLYCHDTITSQQTETYIFQDTCICIAKIPLFHNKQIIQMIVTPFDSVLSRYTIFDPDMVLLFRLNSRIRPKMYINIHTTGKKRDFKNTRTTLAPWNFSLVVYIIVYVCVCVRT